jgi:hypothetical protein
MSRRDSANVAWHDVPGTAPPQKSRPVGYGVIRAGVHTDSIIEATKFRIRKLKIFMFSRTLSRALRATAVWTFQERFMPQEQARTVC